MSEVVLVDEMDNEVGVMEKLQAHHLGLLHRAFSIFVLNKEGEMLIHQRAMEKYHSGGLWTNACCSHPLPGENVDFAAKRRLSEEMGLDCDLKKIFEFTYQADVGDGLIEHEFDHVFIGYTQSSPIVDSSEVMDWKWVSMEMLITDMIAQPESFTTWFKIALPKFQEYFIHQNLKLTQ
jgi:isopentenyl-diphosphate delta-isomerase